MISRMFAYDHGNHIDCYKGFDKKFDEIVPYLAIVKVGDTIETWALDTAFAVGELVKFYEEHSSSEHWQLLSVFKNLRAI